MYEYVFKNIEILWNGGHFSLNISSEKLGFKSKSNKIRIKL
jgi:hypothetical protein